MHSFNKQHCIKYGFIALIIGVFIVVYLLILIQSIKPPPLELSTLFGWEKVETGCRFSFLAPVGMKEEAVTSKDSCVGAYHNDSILLTFDYGPHADPYELENLEHVKETWTTIDGNQAKIVTLPLPDAQTQIDELQYTTAVHFPSVGDGNNKLTMTAHVPMIEAVNIAQTVFSTIRFTANISSQHISEDPS